VIIRRILSNIRFSFILAGDVVEKRKPEADIYLLLFSKASMSPGQCICIEDSHYGVMAAKEAALRVAVTANIETEDEDLSAADIVVSSLGDPDGGAGRAQAGRRRHGVQRHFHYQTVRAILLEENSF
jgi:beta-phosphoglucomutase-like phosphatase (HAD superfamily)